MKMTSAVAVLSAVLAGCVATGTYRPPMTPGPVPNERTYAAEFDKTWQALVSYSSTAFFSIDAFEKQSGLMTLSFSAQNPTTYVDCGWMQASNGVKSVNEPYAAYLGRTGATLSGKMNITIRPAGDAGTIARVNTRYIFSVPASAAGRHETWAFDTTNIATVVVSNAMPGTIPTRTCRPTFAIEKDVLDGIENALSR